MLSAWKKYDFPIHFVVAYGRLIKECSVFFGSLRAKALLKIHRASYGKNLKVDGFIKIRCAKAGSIVLGENCRINSRFGSNWVGKTNPPVLQCIGDGKIVIGDNSGISFVILSSKSEISIGKHVNIGGNVRVFDHDYHSLNFADRRDGTRDRIGCRTAPVKIGDDVFIGTNSIILKGVTIGDRSIVGAGSVVVSNIPPDEVWAGNPARRIKVLK